VAATVAVKVTDWPDNDGDGATPTTVEVLAWFTVCEREVDVLGRYSDAPRYWAVTEWAPTARSVRVMAAWPPERVTATGVPPSTANWTVPVGVPEADATVAVNVTGWPKTVVWTLEVRAVVVGAFTV
jgi:hypothetical protein